MGYKLIFDKKSIDALKKIPKKTRKRVFEKILETKIKTKLWVKLENRKDYKLRIGNYRVIADLNHTKNEITITKIGHRKNIYKK